MTAIQELKLAEIGHTSTTETIDRFQSCKIHETYNNHD
jgi:hypothetical protein